MRLDGLACVTNQAGGMEMNRSSYHGPIYKDEVLASEGAYFSTVMLQRKKTMTNRVNVF